MTYNTISEPSTLVYLLAKLANAVRSRYRKWSQWLRYICIYPQFEEVGEEIILGADVTLNAIAEITFGEDCAIAAGSYFMTWNHVIDDQTVELRTTGKESEPIEVGDGAWVGYDAIVLPGVTIGTGGVVAAGAVVTDDVPDWTVVAGVPAEPIAEHTPDSLETIDDP